MTEVMYTIVILWVVHCKYTVYIHTCILTHLWIDTLVYWYTCLLIYSKVWVLIDIINVLLTYSLQRLFDNIIFQVGLDVNCITQHQQTIIIIIITIITFIHQQLQVKWCVLCHMSLVHHCIQLETTTYRQFHPANSHQTQDQDQPSSRPSHQISVNRHQWTVTIQRTITITNTTCIQRLNTTTVLLHRNMVYYQSPSYHM